MNDAEEWSYAVEMLTKVLKEFKDVNTDEPLLDFQDAIQDIIFFDYFQDIYSFSLSESPDLLSQWRGYCPNGGYSFSFDDWHLDQMVAKYKLIFEPCVYEEEAQREFILNRIIGLRPEQVHADYQLGNAAKYTKKAISDKIISSFFLLGLIKHPTFGEEREWRMIAHQSRLGNIKEYLQFRSGHNIIIPYLNLEIPIYPGLHPDNNPNIRELHVNEVIVGPSAQQTLAFNAFRMMLYPKLGMYPKIHKSQIPYRTW
ncbi:DUF2971 domain-containing protein [Siccationidurans soli]|uniref:DUF2971 domain-containing protein n=2 Tax=Hymenobacter negativus TaxID=2795026 RepID=A0ABS3Q9R1_9BACT|nr:DUF2971 domain-containing protein [Hymenobacter negativus]